MYFDRIVTLTVHCFSRSYLFGIFAHRVTWCQNDWISFGNIHFRGELIPLCTSTGIIIHLLLRYNSLPCGT